MNTCAGSQLFVERAELHNMSVRDLDPQVQQALISYHIPDAPHMTCGHELCGRSNIERGGGHRLPSFSQTIEPVHVEFHRYGDGPENEHRGHTRRRVGGSAPESPHQTSLP